MGHLPLPSSWRWYMRRPVAWFVECVTGTYSRDWMLDTTFPYVLSKAVTLNSVNNQTRVGLGLL